MMYVIWSDDGRDCLWYAGGGATAPRLTAAQADAYPVRNPAPIVAAVQKLLGSDALVVAQLANGKARSKRAA